MSITVTVITNNLKRLIVLPPTDSFPNGLRLVPGDNDVPHKYLRELESKELVLHRYTEVADADGNVTVQKKFAGTRFPGREALAALEGPVQPVVGLDLKNPESGVQVIHGYRHGQAGELYTGPQITIHRREEPPEVEPLLPPKLPENLGAALAVVAQTDDPKYLDKWLVDAKGQLKTAITERLKGLK
jgi:hypothetical protein